VERSYRRGRRYVCVKVGEDCGDLQAVKW